MIDNWHFFNFSNFQQLKNKYAKYTLCCVFLIVTQWSKQKKKSSQVGSSSINNFGKYQRKKLFFNKMLVSRLSNSSEPFIIKECSIGPQQAVILKCHSFDVEVENNITEVLVLWHPSLLTLMTFDNLKYS
jgi:hypothetical protein